MRRPRPAVAAPHCAWPLLALLAVGCSQSAEADLALASQEAQFDSVADLGSHRMTATIRRQEVIDSDVIVDATEAVEIRWQSWDAFEMRRLVDGDQVSLIRVVDGQAWAQRADESWVQRGDPEPWRQELRIAWSAWDQALEPFGDRVEMTEPAKEVVEGRRARRYRVGLREAEPDAPPRAKGRKGKRRRRVHGRPEATDLHLDGAVVLDEGTAARLLAQVSGRWTQGPRTHTVALDLSRSGIGLPQTLAIPVPPTPRRPRGKTPEPEPESP